MQIWSGTKHCTAAAFTPYLWLVSNFIWTFALIILECLSCSCFEREWSQFLHSLLPQSPSAYTTLRRWMVLGICFCTHFLDFLCSLRWRGLPPCKANLCLRSFSNFWGIFISLPSSLFYLYIQVLKCKLI